MNMKGANVGGDSSVVEFLTRNIERARVRIHQLLPFRSFGLSTTPQSTKLYRWLPGYRRRLQNCFSTLDSRRTIETDDDPCMSPAVEYD